MNTVTLGWPLAALLVVLTAAAAATTRLAGLGRGRRHRDRGGPRGGRSWRR